MNMNEAHKMIGSLMREHGLLDSGWTWKWDNGKRRFGVCRYGSRQLGFSRPLFSLNSEDECRDTVLHEIAHAIAGHAAGHGPEWRAVCRRIGAKPERLARGIERPPAKWLITCPCGRNNFRRDRLTEKMKRSICSTCREPLIIRENIGAAA